MKKKVFSLMMTLLLAFMGVVKADVVELGGGSTTTNSYLPNYEFYNYSLTQQIYTADEIGTAGTINSIAFYTAASASRTLQVYLVHTSLSAFSSTTAWVVPTSADMVYSGSVSYTAGGWTTLTLSTPFEYNGTDNLCLIVDDNTGSYVSSVSKYVYNANGNQALRIYSDGTDYNALAPTSYTGTQMTQKNRIQLDITPAGGGGGAGAGEQLFAVQNDEVVDTVKVGPRPNGYWMEPFTFQIRNTGAATTITHLDWTPQEYFTLVAPELPVSIARDEDKDVQLTTGESDNTDWQMVAIYGNGRTAAVWNIKAEPYDAQTPDVWEMACTEATSFPFVEVPATAHNATLYNNYTLPFPEIPEGYDAVYKLEFANDMMLDAEVTSGADGKVALYTANFYGEGGPMANNNYQGPTAGAGGGGGGGAAGPFQAMVGDESSTYTTGYLPMYYLYDNSLSTQLYLATELAAAGATTSAMNSISWYSESTYAYNIQNVSIWMANVTATEASATSPLGSGMTLVYQGNFQEVVGWNEFVFNQGSFAWDGTSNVLVMVQMNNGDWSSAIQWKAYNTGLSVSSYTYRDNTGYNAGTESYSMTTSNYRANTMFKSAGRNGNRDIVTIGDQTGYDYYYYPVNMYFNYSLSEQIYTADEIGMAGTINSISFYYNYSSSFSMDNLTLYMKNTEKSEFNSTSDMVAMSLSDIVWSGTLSGASAGWITINLDTPFQYDGTSNLLVGMFDGTSGYPGSSYKFYTHTTTGNKGLTWYSDSYTPDPYTLGSWSGSTNRTSYVNDIQLDITSGGGGGNLPANIAYGPVITEAPVEAGTYYLVASSTDQDFEVTINAVAMPCPQVDGFAFNEIPADDEDEIEPASVTLQWTNPAYATEYQVVFGSTYHPEANHPQTVISDWTPVTGATGSFTVRNLWNNTNYFWHVVFRNAGSCPEGVSSPVWGFTTHLNVPQNLTAVDETVFNDETIVLNWTAVVDRTYRNYFIYRDGVKIGETATNQINATTYTDGPLAYNMNGYVYYVTAVYDEGESAPSNTVTVKVSGRGNVDGHVYEQDGTTGIANATVTMVGTDEFNVNHTYNFTTNAQGYYSGAVYAGTYNGQAACDGYQTIYEPVQGNPIDITYNVTTSPVDYILDENFDAPCGVIAEYYPDSLDPTSPYVKVYWGCGLPGSDIIEDFETGDFSMFDWQVDPSYPWSITTTNPYEGTYCMKSGGAGVASVTSNMTVSVEIPADGLMSFFGKISSESNYDYGYFFIDGVQKGSWSGAGNWAERTYEVTAGMHTFQWRYTKDSSVNSNDDCFYVDYINFYKQPEPPVPGMTYTFEDGTMQGWTSVDADGDGYGWYMGSEIMTGQTGNNGSSDFVLSQSYYQGMILYPDNYLVSPQVALGGVVTFYACAQDASYAAEHFGVAVSTTNTNPSSFTMLQEWTMTAKKAEGKSMDNAVADVNMSGISRDGNSRVQGNWYQYTVDLSAYAGQTGYVAIRHFNCSDMFYLDVDDITISDPGKGVAESSRSLNHYRVYRTNCYNDGPYTEENTVLLATVWVPDTVYIDVEWADLEPGVYKWGVGAVYEGNRGEMIESPISWAAPVAVGNRSFTTSEAAQVGPKVTKEVAAQDRNRDYLQYSTETFTGGVGTGGGAVYWGIRFPAADLAAYAGRTLTTVGVFMDVDGDYGWTYSGTYTAMVYQGGATAPGTLVSTAAEYLPGDLAWHDITLTTPVTIDATQDLWLCFYTPDIAYPMSGCDYVGNANSDFLSLDGTTWDHAGDYGLSYTWMIRGFVEAGGSTPPTPGGNNLNQLALPRESETIWSNCLDKDMYLNDGDVTVNVLLNSADNPEGILVSFTNYNEAEQELYPIDPITLDETGYYAFESFRRGDYKVNVTFDGYEPIEDSVHIWEPTDLRYVMIEIIYGVSDLYVSSTGWAMWGDMGTPGGQGGGGGQGGNGDTFSENFDAGMPAGWTTIDGGSPQGYGWHLGSTTLGTGYGHNGSADLVISQSYDNNYGVIYPDNYLVSPQVNLAAGSQFSFWACAQDASYAAEHFGVFISDNGTSNWTMVNEWTIGQKGERYSGARGQRDQSAWTQYTVDLSAFAGQKYIAIRHFNCSDMYFLDVDDVELTNGAKNAEEERHLESFKVLCTSIDGEPIYNANVPAEQPFCQLATDELVAGDHYICKVAAMYSTGMSDWTECEWQYIPCENYAGTVNGVTIEGNEISWEYPGGGGGGGGQGGNGDTFSENFDAGMPAGWTTIDGGSPQGYGWHLGSTTLGTGYGHNGSADLVISQSYDNNYGVIYPDNYLVSPQVNLAAGSTFSFWACGQDASYAAEHFGVFISDNGTSNWTMVNEWTIGQKGERYEGNRGVRDQSAWTQYTVDLSAFAGQKYIAIRHFNCSDMYFLDVDDVELTNGAKATRDVIAFNGYVTDPGAMANGADASWTKNGQATWGPNVNNGGGYKLADSFTLSAATTISEIEVYGYQTGSSTTSTFTGLYAQIYDGNPMSGGNAIWGSETSNIMTATSFTNCYRGSDGETTATTRPIMAITAGNLNIDLAAGTYWLVYSLEGTGTSGPWGAPHAEPSVGNTGNGVQYTSTGWQTLVDGGTGAGYGCAMTITANGSGPVPPTPTGDVLGAMIFADGEWEAFVEYPTNTYTYEGTAEEVCVRIVYNGPNNLPEGNIYFSMSCPECEPYMPGTIICDAGEPIHGEQVDANHVKVWWGEEPIVPGAGEWYFYDNGVNEDAIGTNGGNFWWGVMFPAGSYQGNMVTKVAAYDYMAMTGNVTIYNDGATAPANAVGQMNVTMTGAEDFVEYEFAEPVVIDPTKNVWVVFYNGSGATFPAAVCANTGDANGRWVSLDGNVWEDISTYNLDNTFMVRAYIAQGAKGEVREIAIEQPAGDGGVLALSGNGARVSRNRASLVKYNVYRSADNETYELIGEVAEDGSGYYEYIDSPTVAGTYYYQVRAYYDNECESEPAKAYDNPTVDYVMLNTTAAGVDENGGMAIFPNPTKGNVTIQAAGMQHITVVSVLGQVVYDADVAGDELILNMSKYTAGMYTVRVMTENGVRVERITVIR